MSGYSEYTKLRDIAHKRTQRLSNKGLAPEINFPTVKELKAKNISAEAAIQTIQKFVNAPTTVRQFKTLEPAQRVNVVLTAKNAVQYERRKAQKREASKRYRERMKSLTNRERGYIKAAHTLGLKKVSDIKAFGEYIEMRFSQSSEQSPYAIADYIDDFQALQDKPGYDVSQIKNDYQQFLSDRQAMIESSNNMDGISLTDGDSLFSSFMNFILGE